MIGGTSVRIIYYIHVLLTQSNKQILMCYCDKKKTKSLYEKKVPTNMLYYRMLAPCCPV